MIAFILTMPRNNSWNGKWTGDESLFCRIMENRSVPKEYHGKDFQYDFGDGWVANVEVRKVDCKEANRMRKKSRGFCGYDWMIRSILANGYIEHERYG